MYVDECVAMVSQLKCLCIDVFVCVLACVAICINTLTASCFWG